MNQQMRGKHRQRAVPEAVITAQRRVARQQGQQQENQENATGQRGTKHALQLRDQPRRETREALQQRGTVGAQPRFGANQLLEIMQHENQRQRQGKGGQIHGFLRVVGDLHTR